jgi:predicted  nucleic acid-binding Zn-ribbon protein
MGSLDDWRKAQRYVENLNKAVTGVQLNGHIKALESENASLKSQLSDLNNKFSELIERFEKASALQSAMRSVASSVSVDASPRKRGRPSKIRDASEIVTRDDLGEGAVIGDLTMGAGE